jgi:hypothetical protein
MIARLQAHFFGRQHFGERPLCAKSGLSGILVSGNRFGLVYQSPLPDIARRFADRLGPASDADFSPNQSIDSSR